MSPLSDPTGYPFSSTCWFAPAASAGWNFRLEHQEDVAREHEELPPPHCHGHLVKAEAQRDLVWDVWVCSGPVALQQCTEGLRHEVFSSIKVPSVREGGISPIRLWFQNSCGSVGGSELRPQQGHIPTTGKNFHRVRSRCMLEIFLETCLSSSDYPAWKWHFQTRHLAFCWRKKTTPQEWSL